jgi:hypothetical protein
VATFHLGRIEVGQQAVGRTSCIKVQAASLSGEECPEITWDEFQVTGSCKKLPELLNRVQCYDLEK